MVADRPLLGREEEQHQIHTLLGKARNGRGGSLLLSGEPGIGKTTLLEAALDATTGHRVLRIDGFEAEATIPFAGLQRLAIPLRDHVEDLPRKHQAALLIASGVADGPPPDRFLVGLAVLELLAAAAEEEPVVCAVDDAHFLDAESLDVLAFVARRLEAESVALLLAARPEPAVEARTAGIEVLHLAGLAPDVAARLLTSSLPEAIDPAAARQIAIATGGNPLALIDLASELSARHLAESTFADEPFPVGHHLEALYLRRVRHLHDDVQLWLLIAAADSTGNLQLIQGAAGLLDVPVDSGDAAEEAGLVRLGETVTFHHPLVRSASYNAAHGAVRRRVHGALSRTAADLGQVELEAWHAAKATLGFDAEVADRLESVADLAGRRGGSSSRANVLSTASTLTPPGPEKYRRLVLAAEAALTTGAAHLARTLLDDVDEDLLDPVSRGRLLTTRSSIALFTADPALVESGAHMLAAAESFHGHDRLREQHALIKAFEYTLPAERLARGASLQELGQRMAKAADGDDGTAATILRGLSALVLRPYAEAVPLMRSAVDAILALDHEGLLEYAATTSGVALTSALWDAAGRREVLTRTAEAARDSGSLQLLDTTLWVSSAAELVAGTPSRAGDFTEQVRELRRAIGYDAEQVINVAYLAWAGAPRDQVELINQAAAAMGFGGVESTGIHALAARDLAEGEYAAAYERLRPIFDEPYLHTTPLALPELVEAAVRCGRPDEARRALHDHRARAEACGTPWARGVTERLTGMVEPDAPEPHLLESIGILEGAGIEVELGRSCLVHGEWLRRARRRRDAQAQLRRAREIFDRTGATAFAGRARRELEALGDHAPDESAAGPLARLTTQELTVSRLAAAGQTNAEIGATLFLSVNTIDYHLRKVFQKLGISSRRQLKDRLDQGA